MAFEEKLAFGEGSVEAGQRGHKLSKIREQQVQRPRGRSRPGEFRNSPGGNLAKERRKAKDEV